MNGTSERLEELLFSSSSQPFSEAARVELNALPRDNAEARTFAARFLALDALLAENLAASESRRHHTVAFDPITISAGKSAPNRPNWLARAAAWIGAFQLLGNTAKAASATSAATGATVVTHSTIVILMKKTVASITAAILVLGGSGIYVIHRNNESSRARVETMESEIQSLSDQLGLESLTIDRSLARLRFAAQVVSNPTEGAAMLAAMLPADVTAALKEVTDPDVLRQILPKLTPEQMGPAAEGAIKAMAATDINSAFTWAKSLEMGDKERDSPTAATIRISRSKPTSRKWPDRERSIRRSPSPTPATWECFNRIISAGRP
jgi:hypothetical protein